MESSESSENLRDENRLIVRKRSSVSFPGSARPLDPLSIENDFHRSARPSLVGSGSYTMTLSWEHLNVTVKIPGKRSMFCKEISPPTERLILKDVSGTVAPGSLVAIMGASGSGKTTLLNVLTNRNTKDYIATGTFRLNGVKVDEGIKNVSAYVQQNDLFLPTITVREHLQFRASLRMDKHMDKKSRLERVEEVILEMGLTACSDRMIGSKSAGTKGISGGEKKCLSFASESLTGPPIFFCDEPMSGLDSYMARTIMSTLQQMAKRGATILCTIHQPSSEIFAGFSRIILLSEGRNAFMGGNVEALEFFEKNGYPCPDNYNPADHYILTLAVVPGKEEESRVKNNAICDAFASSSTNRDQLEQSIHLKNTADDVDKTMIKLITELKESDRYKSPIPTQLRFLSWRAWTSQIRNPMLTIVRIAQSAVLAIVMGLIYLDLDINQSAIQNMNGAIFCMSAAISFNNAFTVISSFPEEIDIVMREFGTGVYRLDTYFFTKTVTEFPLFLLSSLLFVVTTYWMIGFNSSFGAFVEIGGILLMISLISGVYGYWLSIVTGSASLGVSILSSSLVPLFLFAGLFLNNDDVPDYFVWLKYISWFKYSFEYILVKQWQDVDHIDCDTGSNTTVCAYLTGQDVLDVFSMDKDALNEDIACLFAIFLGFYLCTFGLLAIRGKLSRE